MIERDDPWTSILIKARRCFSNFEKQRGVRAQRLSIECQARRVYKIADLTFNIHVSIVGWLTSWQTN